VDKINWWWVVRLGTGMEWRQAAISVSPLRSNRPNIRDADWLHGHLTSAHWFSVDVPSVLPVHEPRLVVSTGGYP